MPDSPVIYLLNHILNHSFPLGLNKRAFNHFLNQIATIYPKLLHSINHHHFPPKYSNFSSISLNHDHQENLAYQLFSIYSFLCFSKRLPYS